MEVRDAHGVARLLVALALHGEGGGLQQVAAALAPRHLDDAAQRLSTTLRVGDRVRQELTQRPQQHVHQRARPCRRLLANHGDAVRRNRFAGISDSLGTLGRVVVAEEGKDAVEEKGAVRQLLQRRATQRHVLQEAAEARLPRDEEEVERATHVLDQVLLLFAVGPRVQTVASKKKRPQSNVPLGRVE